MRSAVPCVCAPLSSSSRRSGYLLGEFGHLLNTGPTEYFGLLQQRFAACNLPTKALLLSAYAKAREARFRAKAAF